MLGGLGGVVAGMGSVLTGTATFALAYVGYRGLSAWKLQLTAGRKMALGEELLTAIYEIDAILQYITAPFLGDAELEKVEQRDGESDESFVTRQTFQVISNRYAAHADSFNKLRTLCFGAKATFGQAVYDAAIEVFKFPHEILGAVRKLSLQQERCSRLRRQMEMGLNVNMAQLQKAMEDYDAAFDYFYGLDEGDALNTRREAAVKNVEDLIRGSLRDL